MEVVERQTREKYTKTRSKLAEYEANIQNLHATVKQLEIQLNHSQKVTIPKSNSLKTYFILIYFRTMFDVVSAIYGYKFI